MSRNLSGRFREIEAKINSHKQNYIVQVYAMRMRYTLVCITKIIDLILISQLKSCLSINHLKIY